jgi:hypothetical protein
MTTTGPITTFEDDDDGYDAWMAQHEYGYVLKMQRAGQYMIHDHSCAALGNFRERRSMTAKPRFWAERRRTLTDWVKLEGYVLKICSRCG